MEEREVLLGFGVGFWVWEVGPLVVVAPGCGGALDVRPRR